MSKDTSTDVSFASTIKPFNNTFLPNKFSCTVLQILDIRIVMEPNILISFRSFFNFLYDRYNYNPNALSPIHIIKFSSFL